MVEDFKIKVLELLNDKSIPIEEVHRLFPSLDEMVIEQSIIKLKKEAEVFEPKAGFLKKL